MNRKRVNTDLLDSMESKLRRLQQYNSNLTEYDFSSDESLVAENANLENLDPETTLDEEYEDIFDLLDTKQGNCYRNSSIFRI